MKTIEITVAPSGQSKVETKGFTGHECLQASRFLEKSLGKAQHQQLTADYHRQDVQQQQQTRQQ